MTEKEQVEKAADTVLYEKRLDWDIASVEENKPSHTWDIELEVPNGPELIFSVPKGSPQQIKESIRRQVEEEMDRLKSHRPF